MPTATEYNAAVQNLHVTAADEELKAGEPALRPLGLPLEYAGGFAVVYQVRCPKTGKTWAVKCFIKQVAHRRERYEAISRHLRQVQLPFMVGFEYQEQGLLVGGRWEPIVKMDWGEGDPLNGFVAKHLEQRGTLRQLLQLWFKLARRLDAAEVAHADLQHGNFLLVPLAREGVGPRLRLVDYDGMCVPALDVLPPGEVGHAAYQHPERTLNEDSVFILSQLNDDEWLSLQKLEQDRLSDEQVLSQYVDIREVLDEPETRIWLSVEWSEGLKKCQEPFCREHKRTGLFSRRLFAEKNLAPLFFSRVLTCRLLT